MSLIVLEPGIDSRVVDFGRPHSRSLGVPVGGAADRRSLALGNALVGNPPHAAALEITLKGPSLEAKCDLACAIFGAPIKFNTWDGPIQSRNGSFELRSARFVDLGGIPEGARVYFCVRGGFDAQTILGSRSALEPIKKGDVLSCRSSAIHTRFCPELTWTPFHSDTISVVSGLQAFWFDESEFYNESFTVTPASNRMGLRLQGKPLTMPKREMISEPVCPGAVQVTPDGQCIVLGVDGQTIGGYPKIAQVIQADLDTLGQLRPCQAIQFKKITLDEAIQRDRQAQAELRQWTMRLRLSLDAFPAERRFLSS